MLLWGRFWLWPALRRTYSHWQEDEGSMMAAAMAYYAAFSIFPLCLVLIAGLGYVMRYSAAAQNEKQQLLQVVAENTTPELADQLGHMLEGVRTRAGLGGPLGLVGLLLAAIGIFTQLEFVFARMWNVPDREPASFWKAVRRALYDRLLAFVLLVGLGSLMFVVFVANLALASVRSYAVQLPAGQTAWGAVQVVANLAINIVAFTIMYRVLPRRPVRWKSALGGGILAALIWEAGQQLLARVIIADRYSAYGIVGAFIALMLWMYYASAVVLLGGEFVRAISGDTQVEELRSD
ncbi:MAG: YihY/virulence factor BrkB family protein [Pirellulales bacterium]|nr:YihY/virulence factor BrkB family protein [Pirellulales bacterium]